jgi:hypothetical protein
MDAEVIADLDGMNISKVLYIATLDSKYTSAPTRDFGVTHKGYGTKKMTLK